MIASSPAYQEIRKKFPHEMCWFFSSLYLKAPRPSMEKMGKGVDYVLERMRDIKEEVIL